MKQVIVVVKEDTSEINNLLNQGWTIDHQSIVSDKIVYSLKKNDTKEVWHTVNLNSNNLTLTSHPKNGVKQKEDKPKSFNPFNVYGGKCTLIPKTSGSGSQKGSLVYIPDTGKVYIIQ